MLLYAPFFYTMELLIWSNELNGLIESSSGKSFSDKDIETIKTDRVKKVEIKAKINLGTEVFTPCIESLKRVFKGRCR